MNMPEISTYAELSLYPFLLVFGGILIPIYQLTGVAFTVLVSQAISLGLAVFLVLRKFRYR